MTGPEDQLSWQTAVATAPANSESALLVITTSFPIVRDGSEAAGSFVADLVLELSVHGRVFVVAPGVRSEREVWTPSLSIFRYAAPNRALSSFRLWHPVDLLSLLAVLRAGRHASHAALAAGKVRHVLALWALPSGHWARSVAKLVHIQYSVWTLGSDIWSLGRIPLVRAYLRRILRHARHCYSDGLLLARDTEAIAERRVAFLPSTRAIEGSRTAPLRQLPPYRLLFLGRWHPNKGIDLLLAALRALPDRSWLSISLVHICGGGPMAAQVQSEVASLQRQGRPILLGGYLDKAEAVQAITAADYLLLPSRVESIPVVFSDAMKLLCPVLAMPVGDLPALIDTQTPCGLVASSVDAAAFAELLQAALTTAPANFEIGMRAAASHFDLGRIAQQIHTELTQ